MAYVGLEFHDTYFRAGIQTDETYRVISNVYGEEKTPAVLYVTDSGEHHIGYPPEGTDCEVIHNIFQHIGSEAGTYSGTDIAKLVLLQVKEDVERASGEFIEKLVISIPPSYTHRECVALYAAAKSVRVPLRKLICNTDAVAYSHVSESMLSVDDGEQTFAVLRLENGLFEFGVYQQQAHDESFTFLEVLARRNQKKDLLRSLIELVAAKLLHTILSSASLPLKEEYQEIRARCYREAEGIIQRSGKEIPCSVEMSTLYSNASGAYSIKGDIFLEWLEIVLDLPAEYINGPEQPSVLVVDDFSDNSFVLQTLFQAWAPKVLFSTDKKHILETACRYATIDKKRMPILCMTQTLHPIQIRTKTGFHTVCSKDISAPWAQRMTLITPPGVCRPLDIVVYQGEMPMMWSTFTPRKGQTGIYIDITIKEDDSYLLSGVIKNLAWAGEHTMEMVDPKSFHLSGLNLPEDKWFDA